MRYDPLGGTAPGGPIDADSHYFFCRDASWDSSGYSWMPKVACSGNVECETITCVGETKKCAHDLFLFGWRVQRALHRETDKPGDSPRTCQDGHDNDCQGGDEKCEEDEDNVLQWVMVGIAAVSLVVSVAPSIANAFTPAAETAANAASTAAPVFQTIPTGVPGAWGQLPPIHAGMVPMA